MTVIGGLAWNRGLTIWEEEENPKEHQEEKGPFGSSHNVVVALQSLSEPVRAFLEFGWLLFYFLRPRGGIWNRLLRDWKKVVPPPSPQVPLDRPWRQVPVTKGPTVGRSDPPVSTTE